MSGQKKPGAAEVAALMNRHRCPTPFHAARALFMGCIASPAPDRLLIHAIQELWGGNFPQADSLEDLNHLLLVLSNGLWNRLIVHQDARKPFKLTRLKLKPTREGVHHYALVRQQEIEGFMAGVFGPHEELDLPETASDGLDTIGEIRAMLAGSVNLLADPDMPASPPHLTGLTDNLQALELILEQELNSVIVSCTNARRQRLAGRRFEGTRVEGSQGSKPTGPKPTVH